MIWSYRPELNWPFMTWPHISTIRSSSTTLYHLLSSSPLPSHPVHIFTSPFRPVRVCLFFNKGKKNFNIFLTFRKKKIFFFFLLSHRLDPNPTPLTSIVLRNWWDTILDLYSLLGVLSCSWFKTGITCNECFARSFRCYHHILSVNRTESVGGTILIISRGKIISKKEEKNKKKERKK